MKPKKFFGQHFLTSLYYAKRIAQSICASSNENVLEIGPGKGALSIYLKEIYPNFHCVEIDKDCINILYQKLGKGSYVIHHCDVLKFDFGTAGFPLHVVGNLPYSIGALIIKKTLLYGQNILSCTFMVQREVAQRIIAQVSSKQRSFFTVFCNFFGTPKILFTVPQGAFFPKPKVESAVIKLEIDKNINQKLPQQYWPDFFSFVDKGFKMKRKKLINSLGHNADKYFYKNIFNELNINENCRAEDLTLNQWLDLFKLSCEKKI
jgi:16S rRNA (adenine1518-N6/adenine1519-N6)-dimethyltransferase